MKIGTSSVHHTSLPMNKLDPRHMNTSGQGDLDKDVEKSFADIFFKAVDSVNAEQHHADHLQQDAILAPDSVNVADILVAVEKARLSVGMLKAVSERASRAYTDIMNIR